MWKDAKTTTPPTDRPLVAHSKGSYDFKLVQYRPDLVGVTRYVWDGTCGNSYTDFPGTLWAEAPEGTIIH